MAYIGHMFIVVMKNGNKKQYIKLVMAGGKSKII